MPTSVGKFNSCCCGGGQGWKQIVGIKWWPGWKGFRAAPTSESFWLAQNAYPYGLAAYSSREQPWTTTKYTGYSSATRGYYRSIENDTAVTTEFHTNGQFTMDWSSDYGDLDSAFHHYYQDSPFTGVVDETYTWNRSQGRLRDLVSTLYIPNPDQLAGPYIPPLSAGGDGTVKVWGWLPGGELPTVEPQYLIPGFIVNESLDYTDDHLHYFYSISGSTAGAQIYSEKEYTIDLRNPVSILSASNLAFDLVKTVPMTETPVSVTGVVNGRSWSDFDAPITLNFSLFNQGPTQTGGGGTNMIAILKRRESGGALKIMLDGINNITSYPSYVSAFGPAVYDNGPQSGAGGFLRDPLGPGSWWDWPLLSASVVAIRTGIGLSIGLICGNPKTPGPLGAYYNADFETVYPFDLSQGGTGQAQAAICGANNIARGFHIFDPTTLRQWTPFGISAIDFAGMGVRPNCCP